MKSALEVDLGVLKVLGEKSEDNEGREKRNAVNLVLRAKEQAVR